MKVIYPGMFDPVTLGHIDIINRAAALFDEVIIAVANNSSKTPWFTLDQRVYFVEKSTTKANCQVTSFDGLLADFMKQQGINTMIRGVRNASDYDYEARVFYLNKMLLPELDIVFFAANPQFQNISATFVRDMIKHSGNLEKFVPNSVIDSLSA